MNIKNLLMYSAIAGLFFMSSCADEVSNTTGWNYNDSKNGGFQKYRKQVQVLYWLKAVHSRWAVFNKM